MAKTPMNPLAGPSGPSIYSTRTDKLSLGSTSYGEGKETAALNTAAVKSKTRGSADDVGGRPANPVMQTPVVKLYDESQRPNQNILAGVDRGADVGSSALMMKKSTVKLSDTLEALIPFDDTGEIAVLFQDARSRGN
jgi:hypothetical protein